MSGCRGLCCAAFNISAHTLPEIRKAAREGTIHEADKLAEMLVPLTPKEARERNERFGGDGGGFEWKNRGHHFTCKWWDEETRLCTNYENRPSMCRKFPYGKPCPWGCDCTDS